MNEIAAEHQAMIDMLLKKYGREKIISAMPVKGNNGRPENAKQNGAVVWAHLQFLQKYRVEQTKKKLESACDMLAKNLDRYLARRRRQGWSAFRKMHFEAQKLARVDANFSLFMTNFGNQLDDLAANNPDLVLLPMLEEGTKEGLRAPVFDMHSSLRESAPFVQIHVWNDPRFLPVVTFVLDPTQKIFE
jgi:iron-sulfur cluster repair protein YtfE (RIC family)